MFFHLLQINNLGFTQLGNSFAGFACGHSCDCSHLAVWLALDGPRVGCQLARLGRLGWQRLSLSLSMCSSRRLDRFSSYGGSQGPKRARGAVVRPLQALSRNSCKITFTTLYFINHKISSHTRGRETDPISWWKIPQNHLARGQQRDGRNLWPLINW